MEVLGFIRKMRLHFSTRFFTKFSTRFSGVPSGEVLVNGVRRWSRPWSLREVILMDTSGDLGALVRDVFPESFF